MNHSLTASRLYRQFHGAIVYPAIVRTRGEGHLFAQLLELQSIQWWPIEQLRLRQSLRLTALLEHASLYSPFYAAKWNGERFTNEHVWEQLRSLPIIGKADLQESQSRMVVQPRPRRVTRKVTGGSTGEAVTVLKDRAATAAERAASWLGYGWFGVAPGDLGVRFWGNPVTFERRFLYAAADLAMNRLRFSAFAFTDADLDQYWERCQRVRPDYFYGYVSMLVALAQRVLESGAPRGLHTLKAVITTAEVLTGPQRAVLSEAFGAPVQNEYGCGEVGAIAYECQRGSLHLMTDNHVVEILRGDGSPADVGETGEIVITDLNNRAMPLVRYRVGDSAVVGASCDCGRGLPVLERVWGREYDLVLTPDGRRYHGEFFMYLFEDLRGEGIPVQQFQVVQLDESNIEVLLVYRGDPSTEIEKAVEVGLCKRLSCMQVSVRRVTEIARKRSGKMSVVENLWRPRSSESTAETVGRGQ